MRVLDYFKSHFPEAGRYSNSGIDVSGHQSPNVIDELLQAGHRFDWVVTKYTEGASFAEFLAVTQRQEALAAGLSHGCYHWISYRTSPTFEFLNFSEHLNRVGIPEPTAALPVAIWLDAEDTGYPKHVVGGSGYTDYTIELADRLEQHLQMPIGIYTASWWSEGRLDSRCAKYPLWVAEYENSGRTWWNYREPVVPSAWGDRLPMAWQWSSLTSAFGSLDLNVLDPTVLVDSPYVKPFSYQSNQSPTVIPQRIHHRPADLKGDSVTMHVLQDDNNSLYLVRDDRKLLLSDALKEIMPESNVTPTAVIDTANELFSAGLTSIPWVRAGYLALGVIPWEANRNPNDQASYWSDRG